MGIMFSREKLDFGVEYLRVPKFTELCGLNVVYIIFNGIISISINAIIL